MVPWETDVQISVLYFFLFWLHSLSAVSRDRAPGTKSTIPTALLLGVFQGLIKWKPSFAFVYPVDLAWGHIWQVPGPLWYWHWLWWISPSCIIHRPLLTYQVSSRSDEKKLWTDGWTDEADIKSAFMRKPEFGGHFIKCTKSIFHCIMPTSVYARRDFLLRN